jgi:hypothetical protein
MTLPDVLAFLNEHRIPYGLQTYSGGTLNVWIGENWERKAQTNITSDDPQLLAAWLLENVLMLFPQLATDQASRHRA